jgi:hypothetical protein
MDEKARELGREIAKRIVQREMSFQTEAMRLDADIKRLSMLRSYMNRVAIKDAIIRDDTDHSFAAIKARDLSKLKYWFRKQRAGLAYLTVNLLRQRLYFRGIRGVCTFTREQCLFWMRKEGLLDDKDCH